MDITGEKDGPPQRAGVAISDLFTGLYGVIAIEAALIARAETGRGQFIDLALLDTTAAILANQAMNFLASGVARAAPGAAHPNLAPYQTFPVADGWSSSPSAMTAQFAPPLRRRSASTALASDARFATNPARVTNCAELARELSAATRLLAAGRRCSPRWKRRSCRPGRSTPSPTFSPIRNSSRAACASTRRERRACAARSS